MLSGSVRRGGVGQGWRATEAETLRGALGGGDGPTHLDLDVAAPEGAEELALDAHGLDPIAVDAIAEAGAAHRRRFGGEAVEYHTDRRVVDAVGAEGHRLDACKQGAVGFGVGAVGAARALMGGINRRAGGGRWWAVRRREDEAEGR